MYLPLCHKCDSLDNEKYLPCINISTHEANDNNSHSLSNISLHILCMASELSREKPRKLCCLPCHWLHRLWRWQRGTLATNTLSRHCWLSSRLQLESPPPSTPVGAAVTARLSLFLFRCPHALIVCEYDFSHLSMTTRVSHSLKFNLEVRCSHSPAWGVPGV